MKKVIQLINDGQHNEGTISGWKRWADKFTLVDSWADADPEVPMVFGANLVSREHREWLKLKRPCFVMNRQMLGQWATKHREYARIAVNSYGNTKLGPMPHDRWTNMNLEIQPWKVNKVINVLIAPPRKSIIYWQGMNGVDWAEPIKKRLELEGANVRIRPKTGKKGAQHFGDLDRGVTGLFGTDGEFEWADLVVSYSSAITAEAFWYGKKVISLGVCPTWVACDNTLDNWQDPTEPANRSLWAHHVSWLQFKYPEWETGDAQEMTVHYQGWPTEVEMPDNPIIG